MAVVKVVLGNRPKNFTRKVEFPMLDGQTGAIEVTFKYRTRTEFGVFIDDLMQSAKAKKSDQDGRDFSMAELMEKTSGANADYILQVVEGWNLDVELSTSSVQQLSEEIPAAAIAIMETYRLACTEGRLGN